MKNLTFRLFVSSTFSDFKEERQLLDEKIFPVVKDYCNGFECEFQLVDLRWGIYTEATLNHKTLPICIEEVERCKNFSPAPNFLALIGERYGWIPLPPFIAKAEFQKILSVLSNYHKMILSEWYILDENEMDGHYYLKARKGDFDKYDLWEDKETEIQKILVQAAKLAGLNRDELIKYEASATEHEIIHGIFDNNKICDNAIVLFRNNHFQKDEEQSKIINLRNKIRNRMESSGALDRLISLDYNENYKELFCQRLIDLLKTHILKEIKRLSKTTEISKVSRYAKYYNESTIYFGNNDAYQRLIEYINNDNRRVMFVTGESGSGKTTLLAKTILDCKKPYAAAFYGESRNTCTLLSSISKIIGAIKEKYKIKDYRNLTATNVSELFYDILYRIPENKEKLLIVIDGVDMFADITELKYNFLPVLLPPCVKIIVSSANQQITGRFVRTGDEHIILSNLSPQEFNSCYNAVLSRSHRCIKDSNQILAIAPIIKRGGSPLYAKLLANISSKWVSGQKIEFVPRTAFDAAVEYIQQIYQNGLHHKETVLYSLAMIAISPLGITESEILKLLYCFDSVRNHFLRESKHVYTAKRLPLAIWSRLFFDLKDCLGLSYLNENMVINFSHSIFKIAMLKSFPSYCEEAKAVLLQYAKEHYADNIRLTRTLLLMLASRKDVSELVVWLTDLDFVNFCVKSGDTSYLIETLSNITNHIDWDMELRTKATKLLFCLNKYSYMLKYYGSEFYTCAYEMELTSSFKPNLYGTYLDSNEIYPNINFPYNKHASIVWSKNGKLVAVYFGSYIHICAAPNMFELSSIYVEPIDSIKIGIEKVSWINDYMIAAFSSNGKILIYDVENEIPKLLQEIDYDTSMTGDSESESNACIRYFQKDNLILYCSSSSVICSELSSQKERFRIDIPKKNSVYIDESSKCFVVFDIKKGKYVFYDMKTGRFSKKIMLRGSSWNGTHMVNAVGYSLHFKKSFVIEKNYSKQMLFKGALGVPFFMICDYESKNTLFIHPPVPEHIVHCIVGDRVALFLYSNSIIAIDLMDLTTKHILISNILSISWIEKDISFSAITSNQKLLIISLSDFSRTDKIFISKHNLFSSTLSSIVKLTGGTFRKSFSPANQLRRFSAGSSTYVDFFSIREDDILDSLKPTHPSLLATENGKLLSVCYEELDLIMVIDENDNNLFVIDHLNLGVKNNILKIKFSRDSKFLMVWTNLFVEVFSVEKANRVLSIALKDNPAAFVSIEDNNIAKICCIDGTFREYALAHRNYTVKQSLKSSNNHEEINALENLRVPYYFHPFEKILKPYFVFDCLFLHDEASNLRKHLNPIRRYFGEKQWLLYKDGAFYLNGKADYLFTNDNQYNFSVCSNDCKNLYESEFEAYISEKNDMSSHLIEFENENYLLLICNSLNSIILFDAKDLKIVSAYRINEKIIGSYIDREQKELHIYTDTQPKRLKFKILLPSR